MKEKQEKYKRNKEERANDIVNASNNLLQYGGVWTSVEQMGKILTVLVEPKDATMAQLKFHKAAGSKAPEQRYFQSETRAGGKRTVFSLEDMKLYMREIIRQNKLNENSASSSSATHLCIRENWEERLTGRRKNH